MDNKKKKILFTIDSLGIGGGEKSLVTLLSLIDYSKYEVDLQLFAYGGKLQQFVPKEVKILLPLDYYNFLEKPFYKQLLQPKNLYSRLTYSKSIRKKGMNHALRAINYWKTVGKVIKSSDKEYDVAIAYAQGIPTFYTVDKIKAKKKIGWVNCRFDISGKIKEFHYSYYRKLNVIILVSSTIFDLFSVKVFPEYKEKMNLLWDINNPDLIKKMSSLMKRDLKEISKDSIKLMTVGRLAYCKGYDMALEAAKVLKAKGHNFKWYIIGEGILRSEIENKIHEYGLEEYFILLGATSNPYPYMKECDVYVQTSRNESFCLTITEARILNRPVVCTNFEGCEMQMKHEKNGLITSFEPKEIADAIIRLINDKKLYSSIQEFQRSEKIGNIEEIEKFYALLEG